MGVTVKKPHNRVQDFLCNFLDCKKQGFGEAVRDLAWQFEPDDETDDDRDFWGGPNDIMRDYRLIPDAYKINARHAVVEAVEVESAWPLTTKKIRAYACLQWELNAWNIKLHLYTLDTNLFWREIDLTPVMAQSTELVEAGWRACS